eukprot:2023198-Prymnesium_polylepis.1
MPQRLTLHCGVVDCLALSRCGRWLMSGARDATALLWALPPRAPGSQPPRVVAEQPVHVLRGHTAPVACVALSSALRLCASGSRDGTVALYTLRDGRRVRRLREPAGKPVEQARPGRMHTRVLKQPRARTPPVALRPHRADERCPSGPCLRLPCNVS